MRGALLLAAVFLGLPAAAAQAAPPPRATAYVFFSSMCTGCRAEMPAVYAWLGRHPQLREIGVGYRETAAQGRKFAAEVGFGAPVIGDPAAELGRRYAVHELVQIVVVRDGRVLMRYQPPAKS
ncbi:MAG TPA: hypothetical protein VMT59_12745 [Gaiellaceae bacterium]|nr:hypothetical protein [Gaiellaceae bacterium]